MPSRPKPTDVGRRTFIKTLGAGVAGATALGAAGPGTAAAQEEALPQGTQLLDLTVNGRRHRLHVEARTTLAELLRDHLHLTGTKVACNRGMCGTCTVLLDGKTVYSCHTLALDAHGKQVLTVEGLMKGEELSPLQQAFVDEDGLQCGYCTPGQIMAAEALLREHPRPTREQIEEGMAGNLCRCAAYPRIIASIETAAKGRK
jgi:xanthine dehydrogenase YagT iron-sulfur-binding subunit